MTEHPTTVDAVDLYHPPWTPAGFTRSGWEARCETCGPLGTPPGYAYGRRQDALAVATRHRRRPPS